MSGSNTESVAPDHNFAGVTPRSRWEKRPKFRMEDDEIGKEKALALENRQG